MNIEELCLQKPPPLLTLHRFLQPDSFTPCFVFPPVTNQNKHCLLLSVLYSNVVWECYPCRQSHWHSKKGTTFNSPQSKLHRPMLFVKTNIVLNHSGPPFLFEVFSTKQNPTGGERGAGGLPGMQCCPSPGSWLHLWGQGEGCPQPCSAFKSLPRRSSPKGSIYTGFSTLLQLSAPTCEGKEHQLLSISGFLIQVYLSHMPWASWDSASHSVS